MPVPTLTTPVTSLDEVYLNLAAKAVMSVQFESRVAGSDDAAKAFAELFRATITGAELGS